MKLKQQQRIKKLSEEDVREAWDLAKKTPKRYVETRRKRDKNGVSFTVSAKIVSFYITKLDVWNIDVIYWYLEMQRKWG